MNMRVVLVEDSKIIQARLLEALGEMPNVDVVGLADSEARALEVLGCTKWDALVLDLQLKEGTGLGVLRALDHNARSPCSKIIVFTNYSFPQYRNRSLLLGADYFFDKAHEFPLLREVLANCAERGSPPISN